MFLLHKERKLLEGEHMLKSFITGIIVSLIIWIAGAVSNINVSRIFFIVSILLIVLAVVLSGLGVSGDRIRANAATETKEDRNWRIDTSKNIILIALPSIIGFFLSYSLH
jgi:heme/copper-type cytochrome/quinol oxidase subunit 2